MRISDWSSDLCSSDLQPVGDAIAVRLHRLDEHRLAARKGHRQRGVERRGDRVAVQPPAALPVIAAEAHVARGDRQVGGGRRPGKAGHMVHTVAKGCWGRKIGFTYIYVNSE